MRYFLLVLLTSMMGLSACARSLIAPTGTQWLLVVVPDGHQEWRYTNPTFVASGGDGSYRWIRDFGDGVVFQEGPTASQAEFQPNITAKLPMTFGLTVFSGGQRVSVTGTIVQ